MGKNFRIPILSIIGVFAPDPEFPQNKSITTPLQKICHITLGENGARPSYGFVNDFIPAAWTAASFVVARVFDRYFFAAAGTVADLGASFFVMVVNEVFRNADSADPLFPVLRQGGNLL